MSRTNSTAVIALLKKDYDTINAPDISGDIEIAGSIVDDIVTNDSDSVMTTAKLELVERALAAWSYACSDKPLSARNTGKSGGTFQGQTEKGFNANLYGQMAMRVDASGYLRAMESKGLVSGLWLGSDYATQEDDAEALQSSGDGE